MDEGTSTIKAKQSQTVTQNHGVSYNLFMLVMNIYALVVMVGLLTT